MRLLSSMATALLLDPAFEKHHTGPGHPECPERIATLRESLAKAGLVDRCLRLTARPATAVEILRVHTEGYFKTATAEIGPATGIGYLSTGDTIYGPGSLDVALEAAGGVLTAVDAVIGGRARNAFCAVRPPGHHATADRGMGFCIFNNVALAARHAREGHGIDRVAIIDWDVHHGNGTQDIFYEDGSVFYFSTHQHPWYPGTGRRDETGTGKGRGTTLNAPLPAGSGMEEIGPAFEAFERRMEAWRPELILISAGFDSRIGDPLGHFRLTDDDFIALTRRLLRIAESSAGGRLISVLEGGYSLPGLATAAGAHLRTLLEV